MCNLFERVIARKRRLSELFQIDQRFLREDNRRRARTGRRSGAGFRVCRLAENAETRPNYSNEAKQQRVTLVKREKQIGRASCREERETEIRTEEERV